MVSQKKQMFFFMIGSDYYSYLPCISLAKLVQYILSLVAMLVNCGCSPKKIANITASIFKPSSPKKRKRAKKNYVAYLFIYFCCAVWLRCIITQTDNNYLVTCFLSSFFPSRIKKNFLCDTHFFWCEYIIMTRHNIIFLSYYTACLLFTDYLLYFLL